MTTLNVKNRQSLEPARRSHLQWRPMRDDRRRRDIDAASAGLLSQHLLRKQNQNQPAHQTNRNEPERIKLAMNRSLKPQKVLPMF